ncbi:MAG: ABC transporter ATP-binding protein [Clostridiales bacterium]|nr:ABC transporter ATP-binding protein [Clostridiales bacterium]
MQQQTKKFTNSALTGHFLKGSLSMFMLVIVTSIFVTLLNTIVPKIVGFTIDSVLGQQPPSATFAAVIDIFGGLDRIKRDIWIVAVAVIVIALVTFIFHYLRHFLTVRANEIFVKRVRDECFTHLQRLPLSWHGEHRTGDIIQRCTSDVDTISNFVTNQLLGLFRIVLLLVLSVVFMFTINVRLAAIAVSFIPVIVGYSVVYYFYIFKRVKTCDEQEGVLSAIAQENLTGVRVVRAFGKERFEQTKFDKQNKYYTNLWVNVERTMAIFWTSSDLILALQLLVIVTVGTVYCVHGQLTAGSLVAFISYNMMMQGPVRMLGRIISNLSKAGVSLTRIAEIMNAEEEQYGEYEAVSGDIVFDNVSFEYEQGKRVLEGISFSVKEGSTVGIIGSTGSGKSTVAYLLDRLYDPTEGTITVGGKSITEIPRAAIRKNMGLILQESYIYSRSISENIGGAVDGATLDDIRSVAKTACIDDNIMSFASGYDTIVGERGVTLSGGQRQRVAIARTLLRRTPYVIFDDSLSAVDSETDASIRKNLETVKGATTFIVSHRINTVKNADQIIVFDGGRVAEIGTNDELLEKGGLYSKIYELQMALPDELKEEVNG